eukprot:1491590-Rhodomonas_salina.1
MEQGSGRGGVACQGGVTGWDGGMSRTWWHSVRASGDGASYFKLSIEQVISECRSYPTMTCLATRLVPVCPQRVAGLDGLSTTPGLVQPPVL